MCAGDVPRSGGLGAREELMQSRGLTRSGFRWRPTNFGGPLQLIWRTQPTGSKTPGGAGTHTGHTGAHGHTDHAQTTVSGVPRLPQGSHRLTGPTVPINFRRHFLPSGVPRSGVLMMMCFSASRLCAVCPTIRPLTALRTCVRALRRGGAHRHARTPRGARTHSHNGTHKSSPHYMRACVRHTHPIAINCIPFGRRRPWKVLEERPRSRGEPSRAWPRAHHVALVSLFDGTQRRSRPARARHGARLTPQ
jgi:hypothetical protein